MMLRSLANPNYRLYFAGQGVSLIGTWMQSLAMAWLVYRLTDDPFWLGVVNFSQQFPSFFVAPLAGVLSDRWNRHRVIVITQTLSMLQAFALAYLAWIGDVEVWQLVVLSIFLGVVFAFDMTSRQAFLVQLVERREDLANAIALNSSMVNGARLVGPAIAGLLLKSAGEAICFLLNGISFLAVIVALLLMRVPPQERPASHPPLIEGMREGARYAFGFPPIRAILLLLALVSFVGLPYTVLMPVFAVQVLGGGPDTLGYLMGASGVGALSGALYLASRRSVLGLGRHIAFAPVGFGLGLIGFSLSTTLWLSMVLLFVIGFAMMVQMASSNTLLQTITDEDKRGRVMSFYMMAFMGMSPLGGLAAGALAARISAAQTLMLGGGICVVGGLLFSWGLPKLRPHVRPVYRRMGLLTEVARGIEAASEPAPPEES
jgi:MFS family permease